ncbi:hypothetical protein AB0J57_25340 [Streptomyces sp. NPDC049837]|uniref:hypothetical protein n=1 Tax=Streptomyces sp. NPDC049837 TaxID=3155277 RepID=UPI003420DFD4
MGLLISAGLLGLLALVQWCMRFTQVAGGVLCLVAVTLFLLLRRRSTARVTAYVLGGIGIVGLAVSSGVLWAGQELGVF